MPIDGIRRAFLRSGRGSVTTDVSDELAYHFARRVDELVAGGLSPKPFAHSATSIRCVVRWNS
jgi:hypothetical protein